MCLPLSLSRHGQFHRAIDDRKIERRSARRLDGASPQIRGRSQFASSPRRQHVSEDSEAHSLLRDRKANHLSQNETIQRLSQDTSHVRVHLHRWGRRQMVHMRMARMPNRARAEGETGSKRESGATGTISSASSSFQSQVWRGLSHPSIPSRYARGIGTGTRPPPTHNPIGTMTRSALALLACAGTASRRLA